MQWTRRTGLIVVLALVGALGLAGCGKKTLPALSGLPNGTTTTTVATTTSTTAK